MVKFNLAQEREDLSCDFFIRKSSVHIDRYLGFKIYKIESKLARTYLHFSHDSQENKKEFKVNREPWIGLCPQILLTPYLELAQIFESLKSVEIKTIVDLGCAYGRVGIVASSYFKDVHFIGYELIAKRVNEARRIYELNNLKNYDLVECDILSSDFLLPEACVYFIYDFGRIADLKQILLQLIEIMPERNYILVARGEEISSLIKNFYSNDFLKDNIRFEKKYLIYTNTISSNLEKSTL